MHARTDLDSRSILILANCKSEIRTSKALTVNLKKKVKMLKSCALLHVNQIDLFLFAALKANYNECKYLF